MQADAYAGFNHLYEIDRKLAPIIEAACWAHTRRNFFELASINKAPIAAEAVREINGLTALQRVSVRSERSQPLIAELANLHADRYRRAQRPLDPQAWLADVLVRLPDYPARRIGDLLPWNWYSERRAAA